MNKIWAILGGVGIGAFLMYMFDPRSGNRRRALVRDKAVSLSNKAQDTIDKTARDLSNRAKGLMHETKSALTGGGENAENENADNQQDDNQQNFRIHAA